MTRECVVTVLSDANDVVIIRYRFGSVASALSWLAVYVPPEGCYTEVSP